MPERIPKLDKDIKDKLEKVGIEMDKEKRSAIFLQVDQNVETSSSFASGVEMIGIKQALRKYDWLHDYYWKVVSKDRTNTLKK